MIENMVGPGTDVGSLLHKFGINPDVDVATTPEDVWDGPVQPYAFAAAAGNAQVASSNANDTAAGTGLRTLQVEGVLAPPNYLPFTEVVTMAGLAPVLLANNPVYRVNRMYGLTAGATSSNQGIITCQVPAVNVFSVIDVDRGQTLQAIYTVPAGAVVRRFLSWYGNLGRRPPPVRAEIVLQTREPGGPWRTRSIFDLTGEGSTWFNYNFAEFATQSDVVVGPVGTDVRVRCTNISASSTQINSGFQINL